MTRAFGPVSAVAAAALVAAAITILPAASDKVVASTPTPNETPATSAAIVASCTEQAWPYIAAGCLSDQRTGGKAKPARIVSADRMHLTQGAGGH